MLCPCHSQETYERCCSLYHKHKAYPQSPLELMRSRYSAYALSLVDYIIETTHPSSSHYEKDLALWKSRLLSFCKATAFKGLTILGHQEEGEVSFVAHLMQGDKDVSFQERSQFIKDNGRWYYVEGVHES